LVEKEKKKRIVCRRAGGKGEKRKKNGRKSGAKFGKPLKGRFGTIVKIGSGKLSKEKEPAREGRQTGKKNAHM